MDTYWKQFAGRVTGLKHNPFQTARLRLMAYYIVVIAMILAAFSFALFYAQSRNVRDNFESDNTTVPEEMAITNTIDNLRLTIIMIDGVVLVVTAFLSYILAGKTLQPIKNALDAQTQFTADASHEFRTPLAIIKYNGDVALKNSQLSISEARDVIRTSVEETEHLSLIVERLLMLARNENVWHDLATAPVNLTRLVEKTIAKMVILAQAKNISLAATTLESGLVAGNAPALVEMLLNLIQNAIDYTNPGGRINISLTKSHGKLTLMVEDSGIGIDSQDLPHVFKRFYKSDKARALKDGGGLGLSIVQNIVEKHRGVINIQSIPERSTKVVVIFPSI